MAGAFRLLGKKRKLILMGHACGVRVQRVQKVQRVQRVQRVVVAADAASFIKKGRGWRRGLCRRVVFASLRGRQRLRR